MKISCPKCNASGTLPDHEIPEAGRFLSCPRCRHGFTVNKPRQSGDAYLVDTCPACNFSTFGEETFTACPKCGVVVKTFVERQREEQLQQRNKELLAKKFRRDDAPLPEVSTTPVADFVDAMHPVNIIGWGVAAVGIILVSLGGWGLIEYDSSAIRMKLSEQREDQVSAFQVFILYGMSNWIQIIYGISASTAAFLFMKRQRVALKALSYIIRAAIVYIPLSYITGFVFWIFTPIPHSVSSYLIELLYIAFMSALTGLPLFMLERYLHERRITSVVKL